MRLFKDYLLEDRILKKIKIKDLQHEKPHIMRMSGAPGINKALWDKYQGEIDSIEISTDFGRIFTISAEDFSKSIKLRPWIIKFDRDEQYLVSAKWWTIISPDGSLEGKNWLLEGLKSKVDESYTIDDIKQPEGKSEQSQLFNTHRRPY